MDHKDYKFFKANVAWRQAWQRTYGVSIWLRMKSKAKSRGSRHVIWGRFHHGLIKINSDLVYAQRSKRHRRFTLTQMYSKDQVPFPFTMDVGSTYADTGSTKVRILQPASGMDKRFCTLQLMFRGLVLGNNPEKVLELYPKYNLRKY